MVREVKGIEKMSMLGAGRGARERGATQLLGKTNLRVKCQTPSESGFARALTAQHPVTRSDRSTRVCRENGAQIKSCGMRGGA